MRKSGILMHISSLPSPYGIGTLGASSRNFIDFLASAGQSFWQVLPVSPTGFGDSPYQSFSSYAGNPYFIDLDLLSGEGYLNPDEYRHINWGENSEQVDYGMLYSERFKVLEIAAGRLIEKSCIDFDRFCMENASWLEDYALFMALKDEKSGVAWASWEREYRFRDSAVIAAARTRLAEKLEFYKAVQFFFHKQWLDMKAYANSCGIEIIGDIPIYVSPDSADVWTYPEFFRLDEELQPLDVAGCPPDSFTADGQLWGNPLYNWEALKAHDYDWWVRRIDKQFHLFDLLRIDHFRGLDSFYAIPADAENARRGIWHKGPGMELFKALGSRRIIAEDLGFLTASVRRLLADSEYPGMKVLQFAFDGTASDYLPHNIIQNCVAYTGTHDNSTLRGWLESPENVSEVENAKKYLRIRDDDDAVESILTTLLSSVADLTIISMQDLLRLDDSARMNTPGENFGNWQWRMNPGVRLDSIAEWLKDAAMLYGRL